MSEKREDGSAETLAATTTSFQRLPEDEGSPFDESTQQIPAAPADDDEFEFAFVLEDTQTGHSITADDIFSDGKIRPIYPVFNRDLLSETGARDGGDEPERRPFLQVFMGDRNESTSSSSPSFGDDIEGIPPGNFCLWNPDRSPAQSPSRVRKSGSTGSSLRWRIRDLMVRRSHSDGKEKFVFLAAEEKSSQGTEAAAAGDEGKKKLKGKKAAEADLTTAYRKFYGPSGDRATAKGGSASRKSNLPYKSDIVGFFAGLNGLKRAQQPF